MKRNYGNFIERLIWGGTKLTNVEFDLLQHLIASLPPSLRSVVERQFDAYNLVQREVDGCTQFLPHERRDGQQYGRIAAA